MLGRGVRDTLVTEIVFIEAGQHRHSNQFWRRLTTIARGLGGCLEHRLAAGCMNGKQLDPVFGGRPDGTGDDINGSLTLDASIVPGSPDGTVTWLDADLTDGPGTPSVTLNFLDDFTNINASDVFSGLASATTALLASQQAGDLQLPFLYRRNRKSPRL